MLVDEGVKQTYNWGLRQLLYPGIFVPRPPHLMVSLQIRSSKSNERVEVEWGPLKGVVSAQKALQWTETKGFLGGKKEQQRGVIDLLVAVIDLPTRLINDFFLQKANIFCYSVQTCCVLVVVVACSRSSEALLLFIQGILAIMGGTFLPRPWSGPWPEKTFDLKS